MRPDPRPSRRDLLTGRVAPGAEFHVSSLVVHARPAALPALRARLPAMPGVEIAAEGGGKLVVTLETEDEAAIVARLNEISLLEGVMSAALVFHQVEPAAALAETGEPG